MRALQRLAVLVDGGLDEPARHMATETKRWTMVATAAGLKK